MPSKTISILNSSKLGDILYSLPGIRQVCRKYDVKAILYLRTGVMAINSPDGVPRQEVMLTKEGFYSLRLLLYSQPYVQQVKLYTGEKIDINLDVLRQKKVGLPHGNILRYYFYCYPDMQCSLSDVWLEYVDVPDTAAMVKDCIVVSRSFNYRNPWIGYEFLNHNHLDFPIHFIGHEKEAEDFIAAVPRAQWLKCDDFNDIAVAVANCKLFIANQNAVFAVAEGLKVKRILEVCPYANNVIGSDENFCDFYDTKALEWYVREGLK